MSEANGHNGHAKVDGKTWQLGSPAPRLETQRFIRGAGTYVDDLQLPNMLYASFVRSSVAHARIVSIDLSPALEMPGVVAAFSAADMNPDLRPAKGGGSRLVADLESYPLATDKVVHVGEAVAVVIADSRYRAQDATDAVAVDYDVLPVVLDPEQALLPESAKLFESLPTGNLVAEMHVSNDDVEAVFASADHVIKERLRTHRFLACPLEGRVSLASYDGQNHELTVWSSSAGVHGVRSKLAQVLQMPENKVRVIAPDVGGSFGAKNGCYGEDLVLGYLARRLGRPVKWAETRPEHLTTAKHGRDQIHYIELAYNSDGKILGLRDKIIADLGAAESVDNSLSSATLYMTGAYDIQAYQVDGYGVATNKTQHGSLRGIGKADAAFVIERMIDIVARKLGLDPTEVRLKNLVPEEKFPYRTATGALLDSGQYHTCLKKVLDMAGYEQLRKEQQELDRPHIRRGIGVSFVIEPTSSARRGVGGGYASCHLRMEPSGKVSAYPSIGQQGQGHVTTITQILAGRLNVPPEDIVVFESDTSHTPVGPGTGSSRSSVILMPSVQIAAGLLSDKLHKIAAFRLDVDAEDLTFEDGVFQTKGLPGRSIALRDVARIAYNDLDLLPPGVDPALEVTGYFVNPNIVYQADDRGRHNEFAAYPYEAVVAVVDIDMRTGGMEIVKYFSVHDCGNMLNPRIVQTQHHGCIAQGLGAAIYEELRYDEDGNLINSTFMDYLLPTVNEMPELVLGHLETPTPFTPLGAKGAGETGTLSPPAALGNAIEDALGPLGVKVRETPYTAPRLLKLIKDAAVLGGSNNG